MNDQFGHSIGLGLRVAVADVFNGQPYLHVGTVIDKDIDHQRIRVQYENKIESNWIDCLSFGHKRIIVID